jgi:predicted O-methyltransferase YrrM
MLKTKIMAVAHKLHYVTTLHRQVQRQGRYPAGHYYSPIPSQDDVRGDEVDRTPVDLRDVDLNREGQRHNLEDFSRFYTELPFTEKQSADRRYYFDQAFFCYSDAIFLYSFLRRHNPRRIIEVGSGFSSAVMLDTVERFLPARPEITFIDPNPERLDSLLKDEDISYTSTLRKRVQDVPLDILTNLESGDLLFIDSSHVVKYGSDLVFLLFHVLPRLKPGVFVHFHDIFYPFEYPAEWVAQGMYWNEDYFVRAFLAYNSAWKIELFVNYANFEFKAFIEEKMPLCRKNFGGSLYIRRLDK